MGTHSYYGGGAPAGTNRKTLYTELGVKETATAEEVRAAYLQKAKEFHPDRIPEGLERDTAERQMARLNVIMEALEEPEKRAAYDSELQRQRTAAEADLRRVALNASLQVWQESRRRPGSKGWWIAAGGGFFAAAGVWVAMVLQSDSRETQWWQMNRPHETSARESPKDVQPAKKDVLNKTWTPSPSRAQNTAQAWQMSTLVEASSEDSRSRASAQNVNPLVEEARRALLRQAEPMPAAPVVPPPPARVIVAVAPSAPAPSPAAAPAPKAPAKGDGPWNGLWRYNPKAGGGVGGTFEPLGIDMQLRTTGQRVRGHYNARYQASSKYSDRVEFNFEGWTDGGDILTGGWVDATGARGEFQMKRIGAQVIEMNWWTTAFGRKAALVSGVARLTETQ